MYVNTNATYKYELCRKYTSIFLKQNWINQYWIMSRFSFIQMSHSKLRNRLGVNKATQLVRCYRMLRGLNELDN